MGLILRSVGVVASARAAATFLASGRTKLPDAFLMAAMPSPLPLGYDTSEYPIAPAVCLTAAVTPSEPLAPCPAGQGTSLAAPYVQIVGATAVR